MLYFYIQNEAAKRKYLATCTAFEYTRKLTSVEENLSKKTRMTIRK